MNVAFSQRVANAAKDGQQPSGLRQRIDRQALWSALDHAREARHLTWAALAQEIGTNASTFSRLRRDKGTDADTFARILSWLNAEASAFVRGAPRASTPTLPFPALNSYVHASAPVNDAELRVLDSVVTATLRGMREATRDGAPTVQKRSRSRR